MKSNPIITPSIDFKDGVLTIAGRSIPEDAISFYRETFDIIDKYLKSPESSTTLKIDMDYVNTSSSKVLLDLAKKISKAPNFSMEWHYEEDDEDIKELGEMFQEILKIKVKFFEKIV